MKLQGVKNHEVILLLLTPGEQPQFLTAIQVYHVAPPQADGTHIARTELRIGLLHLVVWFMAVMGPHIDDQHQVEQFMRVTGPHIGDLQVEEQYTVVMVQFAEHQVLVATQIAIDEKITNSSIVDRSEQLSIKTQA